MILRCSALHLCALLLLLSFAAACTDDVVSDDTIPVQDTNIDLADTYRPPPPDVGGLDVNDKLDTTPVDDTAPPIDVDPLPVDPQFELCILGSHEPTDPECLDQDYLDFEIIPLNSLAERRVSIENTGEVRFEIIDLDFGPTATSDVTMEIAPYRMITDPDNASRKIRDATPTRVRLQPGETLFVDVLAEAGPTAGFIPAESLRIHTDLEDDDGNFLILEIPLEGEIRACPTHSASCDGFAKTGCETDTTNDSKNCGSCGNECGFINIDSACVDSVCEMQGQCTSGFGRCDKDPLAGCSTLLIDNDDHCGACDRSCSRDNADGSCDGVNCEATCHTGFADCNGDLAQDNSDGCEVNLYQDPNHCGSCGQKCDIPNAVNLCTGTGTCTFNACKPGYFDMDGDPSNGCEYLCVPGSGEDRPADNTVFDYKWQEHDINCDGIDGDASRAYFVAPNGDDGNPGTRDQPMRTIQAAIDSIANSSTTIDQVYVSAGNYNEQVTLRSGVSVYGGFSRPNGWERSPSHITTIKNINAYDSGNVIAVKGNNVNNARLQNLTIDAGGANSFITGTNQGASSYGIHCTSCTDLALVGNAINAGVGAPGKDGANGTDNGISGSPGGVGANGEPDGTTPGNGGSSGYSSCQRPGGAGGKGGRRKDYNGFDGEPGQFGISGGAGGTWGDPGVDGRKGSDGTNGTRGSSGARANNTGSLQSNFWHGDIAQNGGKGNPGNGGGGGGGGGGQADCASVWPPKTCVRGSGNGGGGGGGGGCGGQGGFGGTAGGGSFGVFLINSNNALLEKNSIKTAQGGTGGKGGNGAAGADGGNGGAGANHKTDEIGRGGNGGKGGNGGSGGYGGGGAGGPSIPVVTRQSTIQGNVETANTLTFGTGGPGGTSTGNNGATGLAKRHHTL